LIEL